MEWDGRALRTSGQGAADRGEYRQAAGNGEKGMMRRVQLPVGQGHASCKARSALARKSSSQRSGCWSNQRTTTVTIWATVASSGMHERLTTNFGSKREAVANNPSRTPTHSPCKTRLSPDIPFAKSRQPGK